MVRTKVVSGRVFSCDFDTFQYFEIARLRTHLCDEQVRVLVALHAVPCAVGDDEARRVGDGLPALHRRLNVGAG